MIKKCPVCGNVFNTKYTTQLYCSSKCREKHKGVVRFGRLHCIVDIGLIPERKLDEPPSSTEIMMTISLLRDFGINDFNDMPVKFSDQRELRNWKNKKIDQILTEY